MIIDPADEKIFRPEIHKLFERFVFVFELDDFWPGLQIHVVDLLDPENLPDDSEDGGELLFVDHGVVGGGDAADEFGRGQGQLQVLVAVVDAHIDLLVDGLFVDGFGHRQVYQFAEQKSALAPVQKAVHVVRVHRHDFVR